MIKFKCQTKETIKLGNLVPFQDDLKKRTDKDISALAASITDDGLLMPFAVWKHEGTYSLLDGHGRLAALTYLAEQDKDVFNQSYPVVYIEADTVEQAKKSLLQITSSYGKITKEGAVKFCASIPSYHAPAINKFIKEPVKKHKVEKPKTETIIKISVPSEKADQVLELLKQVSYIKVI